jgi:hypothetical protein
MSCAIAAKNLYRALTLNADSNTLRILTVRAHLPIGH